MQTYSKYWEIKKKHQCNFYCRYLCCVAHLFLQTTHFPLVLVLSASPIVTSCAKLLGAEAQCTVVLCSLILHFQHSQVNPGSPRVRYTEKGQPYFSSQEPPTLSTRSPILGDGGELPSSFQVSAFSVVRKIKQMGENYYP